MRITFVVGRYGDMIIGGAEMLASGLARAARNRGWDVEVWTTCVVDDATWVNELPAGMNMDDGIAVRRFPVDTWDATKRHALNRRLLQRQFLQTGYQYDWVASGPHSSALNQHVLQNAKEFDAIVTMPYLHTIPYDAAWLAGENVVLMPCFHNEPLAYMEPFRILLESVSGVIFISPEEAQFAVDRLGIEIKRGAVIGSGVKYNPPPADDSHANEPFLLYVGRLESGKNVPILYDFVSRYAKDGGELKLVVAGDGAYKPPEKPEFEYLGPVSNEEKDRLYSEALALCQPSYNESFSLVIMESWLARRPVLVWSGCDVTRGHVQRSKGGLWFDNYNEFKGTVDWLKENKASADRMGENGNRYVTQNFSWERVFSEFATTLADWGLGERDEYT